MAEAGGDDAARQARLARALADYHRRVDRGEAVDRAGFLAAFPDLVEELRAHWEAIDEVARLADASNDGGGDDPSPARPPPPVIRYFGDYALLEEIARGGMGVVYKAAQLSLGRLVAVKLVLAGRLADEAAVRRFRAEAEAAARLMHPGIVPIYEVGEQDGQHFYSMAFIEGRSLARALAEGPLLPRAAAALIRTVSEAVQ